MCVDVLESMAVFLLDTSGILTWEKLFYLLHKARKLFSSLKLTGP